MGEATPPPSQGIAHWEALAAEADERAAYEESRGSSGAAHRSKAETYRRAAEANRLEATTGQHHCVCCLSPNKGHGGIHR